MKRGLFNTGIAIDQNQVILTGRNIILSHARFTGVATELQPIDQNKFLDLKSFYNKSDVLRGQIEYKFTTFGGNTHNGFNISNPGIINSNTIITGGTKVSNIDIVYIDYGIPILSLMHFSCLLLAIGEIGMNIQGQISPFGKSKLGNFLSPALIIAFQLLTQCTMNQDFRHGDFKHFIFNHSIVEKCLGSTKSGQYIMHNTLGM